MVPLVVGARWHPGTDRCFSPAPLFPKLFPDALPSPASQAVPGEPAATPDRAGPAPGRWLEAGGRCPRCSRQRARAAGAAGARLRLPGTPATAGGDASLAFPPFLFLASLLFAFCSGIPSRPHLAADGCWDSPARRKAERKAEGTQDAIACHLITLLLTRPFLQRCLGTAGLCQLIPLYNKGESIQCLI